MEDSQKYKQCPMCAEDIKAKALLCRYCGTDLAKENVTENGRFVRIKVKSGDKIYTGDIYVTEQMNRISDVVNDKRKFISMSNVVEETKGHDRQIGYLALNKVVVEWVCIEHEEKEPEKPFDAKQIYKDTE